MTSQPGKQIIAIHLLPNKSRRKGNQTIKIAQLTEYNMRNISFEKSFTKYVGETIPRPFSKVSKLSKSQDQIEVYQNISKLSCKPHAFASYKAFSKNKKRSEASLPATFSA